MSTRTLPIAPIVLLALAILTMGILPVVHAQTTPAPTLQVRLIARPLTSGEVTAYKLPATSQLSGGLLTVGLGEPVYVEAQANSDFPASDIANVRWELTYRPPTSAAVLEANPLGASVPIYEPSDRLAFQVAGRTLLRPDIEGAYVVTASVTTSKGQIVTAAQTYVGAKYMGIQTCTLCHGGLLPRDMVTSWSQTGHANLFKEGVDGIANSHYGSACISCHTVGNDANNKVPNGGFTDLAAQLKWVFPTTLKVGNWDAVPAALKNVSNIQCENCHGPGSVHVTGSFDMGLQVNFDSGACSKCHDAPTHHIKSAEWNNSRHAIATRHPSGPGEEACVKCHTGRGFIGKVKGATTVDTTYSAIDCQACHEPHGQPTPSTNLHLVRTAQPVTLADGTKVAAGGLGLLCMNCHQSRQKAATYAATSAGSARFGPHHGPQADMLQGANGFTYGQAIASSKHASAVPDTCVTCHMQTIDDTNDPAFTHAGGHTFLASWRGDGKNAPKDLVGACQKCHGTTMTAFNMPTTDLDGDGKIDGVQTEVQHLLDKVSALLPPVGQPKTSLAIDATWTRSQLEAAYNWQFVAEDGSRGVHNTAYAVGLLKASLADLNKK